MAPPLDLAHLTYQLTQRYLDGVGLIPHLAVWRHDGRDGITWDELQAVKNEALGDDAVCIEVYPAAAQVVNETNRRHLWAIPAGWPVPSLTRR